MKYYLNILLFICLAEFLFAQPDSTKINLNFLGFNSGYGYCRYSDPTESAKIYTGNYFPLIINWITLKNKQIDKFSFFYSSTNLKNSNTTGISNLKSNGKYFQLTYHCDRLIFQKKSFDFYLGGSVAGYMSMRSLTYQYTNSAIVDSNNGDLFISADLSVAAKFKQKENYLLLYFYNSIFAYVNQAIFRTGQKDGHIILLPKFNSLAFNADYKIKMNKHLFFDLGYSFCYYRYPRYGNISITKGAHDQFLAGFNFKF